MVAVRASTDCPPLTGPQMADRNWGATRARNAAASSHTSSSAASKTDGAPDVG